MPHPNGMRKFDELRNLSEGELVNQIDVQFSLGPKERHLMLPQIYRDELIRRHQEESTAKMLGFTGQVRNMTVVIVLATIVNVIFQLL